MSSVSLMAVLSLMSVSSPSFAANAKKAHTAGNPVPAGTYEIDPVHSKVGFEISHLVISTVEGKFDQYGGQIVAGDKPELISTNVEIQTASINTSNEKRDGHLKSADFFEVEKFPKMTFKSDKAIFSGSNVKVPGQLTIKGVTKPVTLEGKYMGTVKGMMGEERMAAQLSTKISRKEFGLTWNKAIEAGPVVGDEATISLKIEAVKKK
jgi:polyisoprenoid-binding protein YceI